MTTFTSEEARQLRDRLPNLDLNASNGPDPLLSSYLSHYGLNRLQVPWPVRHNLGIVDSGQYRLACQTFDVPAEKQQGRIVIVHGYYDHVGLYGHVIRYCLSRGLSVFTFDLPGHGLSSGDPAGIDSFDEYSQALVDCLQASGGQEHHGPWHLMAQSTGASAVINCLLYPERFPLGTTDKIIFLAPLVRPLNWARGQLTFWLARWLVRQVKRDFPRNSHDEEFLEFVARGDPFQAAHLKVSWVRALRDFLRSFDRARPSRIPVHIVQGTDDTTVDWRYNLPRLAEKFPASRTHIIEGARHHLVNESGEFREKLFGILDTLFDLHPAVDPVPGKDVETQSGSG